MPLIHQIAQAALLIGGLSSVTQACTNQECDTRISVTGNLIGNSCTIVAGGEHLEVDLGKISGQQLAPPGSTGPKIPFFIRLEECSPTFTGVTVRFTGTPDENHPELLKVQGGAGGVAISLFMENMKNIIALNTQTGPYTLTGSDSVEIKFYATLTANGDTISAGPVNATATWILEYQ